MTVNQERFSAIGHTGLVFWNPVSGATLDSWIAELPLNRNSYILDVGCGRGELLLRILERFGCRAVGVDKAASSIDAARETAAQRTPWAQLDLHCQEFSPHVYHTRTFDLVSCIGSSHAVGSMPQTLQDLGNLLRPGGLLLLGEGFWRREPDAGYLEFLGAKREDMTTHYGMTLLLEEWGLDPVKSLATPDEDWRHYEDTYADNILRFVAEHPDDPEAPAMKSKIEAWRKAYLRWGHDTLGFGLYLASRRV